MECFNLALLGVNWLMLGNASCRFQGVNGTLQRFLWLLPLMRILITLGWFRGQRVRSLFVSSIYAWVFLLQIYWIFIGDKEGVLAWKVKNLIMSLKANHSLQDKNQTNLKISFFKISMPLLKFWMNLDTWPLRIPSSTSLRLAFWMHLRMGLVTFFERLSECIFK